MPLVVAGHWVVCFINVYWADQMGKQPRLWSSKRALGPFDWRSGPPRPFIWLMISLILVCTGAVASAAIFVGDPQLGVLNFIGLALFLADGAANNPFVSAPHHYTDHDLRVVLATSHHEGTVYILPSQGHGFDAVWSPKISDEHIAADREIMALFRHMRSGRYSPSEPLERLRATLMAYQTRVRVTADQLRHLAAWIYVEPTIPFNESRKVACNRARGVNLLGRELLYALCHAEYLVFMGQARLPQSAQLQLGRLRSMKRSGAGPEGSQGTEAIGFAPGLKGFNQAVKHIYAIFDEEVDASTSDFAETSPPAYSIALSKSPSSAQEYVAVLWDLSCAHSESTFTAMYFFSLVWSMEMGNVNGFHIFPLRCRSRDGDLVSQQILWRQAWYTTLAAQLIIKLPLLLGVFATGLI